MKACWRSSDCLTPYVAAAILKFLLNSAGTRKLSATIFANSGFCTLSRVSSRAGGSPFVLLNGAGTEVGISCHLCLRLCAVCTSAHKIDHALRQPFGTLAQTWMGGFGRRPTLITRSPIAGPSGQLAFQHPVACA